MTYDIIRKYRYGYFIINTYHTEWRTKWHTIDCARNTFLLLQKHLTFGTEFSGLLWRPENVARLRAHIVKLCRALTEDLCRKVVTNARVSLQEIVRENDGHIEHVLHYEQFSSL